MDCCLGGAIQFMQENGLMILTQKYSIKIELFFTIQMMNHL